ncbi:MAG: hypothetical protein ACRCUY_06070 [Thermoguttaceae bacterium]
MKQSFLLFCAIIGVSFGCFFHVHPVLAQLPPALSPWLQLNNFNPGGLLDNYHTFVQPLQQSQSNFQQQNQQLQQLEYQARQSQAPSSQLLQGGAGFGGVGSETLLNAPRKSQSIGGAKGAGFNQYLHYYQGLPQGGVPKYGFSGRRR